MKVVMISLPVPWAEEPAMNPPLGLCYIASMIEDLCDEIVAIDYALMKDYDYDGNWYMMEIPIDADHYFISCMTPQYKWAIEIINYLRIANPKAKIAVGGPHASCCPEDFDMADSVVKGEADYVVINILQGDNYKPRDHKLIKNLDDLPFPNREIFGMENYKRSMDGEKAIHIMTIRGCPYNCAFCSKASVGKNVRYRSVENTMAEIDGLIKQHKTKSFVIYDDIFTLDKNRVFNFCDEFKKRGINWRCWSRTDTLDREKMARMKDSGLRSITLGVESGSDTILRNINKGTTRQINQDALKLCKEFMVPVRCSLMYGNPGESVFTLNETIEMIEETQPDEWNLSVLNPIPGSDIWNNPQKYGIVFDKAWVKKNHYLINNRFGSTGVGDPWISLVGISRQEFMDNLDYFISELERVCPRKKIQDTIQTIKRSEK
jgi:radical SAM superfamily enzyme YgiQ (UPF0313 family)